jgi:uncharacterized membrane protein YagU involved in acid resistance
LGSTNPSKNKQRQKKHYTEKQRLSFRGVRAAQSLVFCLVFCLSLFVFREVRAAQSFVFCVVFCLSLFVFRGVRAAQSLVFCVVFFLSLFVTQKTKD